MEATTWIILLLSLIAVLLALNLFLSYLFGSGLAGVIKSQDTLNKSMQTMSEQMSDLEDKQAEMHKDVRKVTQHFINLAKALKTGQDKPWYSQF